MSFPSRSDIPIAILGMACRLPGGPDLEAFWDLVRTGRSAWGEVPPERFDADLSFHPDRGVRNKSYTKLGGLVEYPPVDRRVCPLSDAAIASYDRAHLALCEVAAAACLDARLNPANLPHRNAGVYVGHTRASGLAGEMTYGLYAPQIAQYLREVAGWEQLAGRLGDAVLAEIVERIRCRCPQRHPDGGPFLTPNHAAALIAKTFGLNGPQMVFNAACASSSQAVAQAVRALQLGRIDMAVVGGASHFHCDTLVTFSQAQSVSNRGSRPFDADADGLVVAEGYAAVVLKRLDRAEADGNRIRATIPGVGVSSDGRGKSLWAPRKEGQIEAVRRAYGPGVRIDRLQYIEAHATSTQLGDATEVQALTEVLRDAIPDGRKIPLGSVKANIGHALETAGLAGLVKTVLAMEHGIIPPLANCRRLNPEIDWDRVPLLVPFKETAWEPWPDGSPRRACVNAFGIGGLNVHLVVDEYQAVSRAQVTGFAGRPAPSAVAGFEPVAIIGIGVVLPGALSLEAYWDLLTSGRDARSEVPPDRWNADLYLRPGVRQPGTTPTKLGGFVRDFHYDWRRHTIPPKTIAQASPLHFMVLQAVDEAFEQAKLDLRTSDRGRIGVIVGSSFVGDFSTQMVLGLQLPRFQRTLAETLRGRGVPEAEIDRIARDYEKVFLEHNPALLDETGSFTSSSLASRITKVFDLGGGGVAVDSGEASSLAALDCCVDLLASGSCDAMVCVGAQQDMGMTKYEAWSLAGRLAPGQPRAPLDAAADGCVPAEGCGVLILKRLADAKRDGNPVYGILRGVGAGHAASRTRAVRLAIERAIARSGVSPADVALVETPGMSKPELDAQEVQAIFDVYGSAARSRPVLLGTTVGQLGHTGAAAGMAELAKAVLALQQQWVPATAGVEQPAPFVAEHQPTLEVATAPTEIRAPSPEQQPIAGVSCGGLEVFYHALIERGTHVSVPIQSLPLREGKAAAQAGAGKTVPGEIVHFDATARRRERMRKKSSASDEGVPRTESVLSSPAALPPRPSPADGRGEKEVEPLLDALGGMPSRGEAAGRHEDVPEVLHHEVTVPVPAALTPGPSPADGRGEETGGMPSRGEAAGRHEDVPEVLHHEVTVPSPAALTPGPSPADGRGETSGMPVEQIEGFLINFVVEQTGYPPEVVEIDADLEADLGIDSIKKAQLFGELREFFPIQPTGNLTLDDFPTLRHVLTFLQAAAGGMPSRGEAAGRHEDVPEVLHHEVTVPTPAALTPGPSPADGRGEETGGMPSRGEAAGRHEDAPEVLHHEVTVPSPAALTPGPSPADGRGETSGMPVEQIEGFLINFVVEQTGYPPEVVEIDADLEADLGIDSIKKAQLFGELREFFPIQPTGNLTLDDFPTLRHILQFLQQAAAGGMPSRGEAAGRHEDAREVLREEETFPSPAALTPGPSPASGRGEEETPPPPAGALESLLMDYVTERTGYPSETVPWDADLEADLGLDPIAKAQMVADLQRELGNGNGGTAPAGDFVTLRQVRDHFAAMNGGRAK